MKHSKEAQKFLKQNDGDPEIRRVIGKGGVRGAEKRFNEILKRASQPLPKQQKGSLKG